MSNEFNKCERCGREIKTGLVLDKETLEKTCVKCMMKKNFEHIGTLGRSTKGKERVVYGNIRT